jgi:hypothetical protein
MGTGALREYGDLVYFILSIGVAVVSALTILAALLGESAALFFAHRSEALIAVIIILALITLILVFVLIIHNVYALFLVIFDSFTVPKRR